MAREKKQNDTFTHLSMCLDAALMGKDVRTKRVRLYSPSVKQNIQVAMDPVTGSKIRLSWPQ